jgi:membrane protein implicated in regulation of membrane protease activity
MVGREDSPASTTGGRAPYVVGAYILAGILLVAPFIALMWVSSYAKDSPRLWGFPFFYWYQLLWVLVTAVCTAVAYVLVHRVDRPREPLTDRNAP